ncbi:HAD-like protein [Pluteus cervinus]|uniref:HAD-like protein n=1 Tax=Pluteus cervinus TaxID=181527 RepID=A0ACD3B241_9AGAR|nr:HAD-like protein [Pluteus cervinus]
MSRALTEHSVLVFDVYATLIDWEAGISKALEPLLGRFPPSVRWSREEALLTYASVEHDLEVRYPGMLYSDLLAKVHEELEKGLNTLAGDEDAQREALTSSTARLRHQAFAESIRCWPLFPDTQAALQSLSKHFKLVVLSNVDRTSFGYTHALLSEGPSPDPISSSLYASPVLKPGQYWFPRAVANSKTPFSLIMTAQDTGIYKPALGGFNKVLETIRTSETLLGGRSPIGQDLTLEEVKEQVLVVSTSIHHDIVPAGRLRVESVWIERPGTGAAAGAAEERNWTWKFETLGEFAEVIEKEFAEKEKC